MINMEMGEIREMDSNWDRALILKATVMPTAHSTIAQLAMPFFLATEFANLAQAPSSVKT